MFIRTLTDRNGLEIVIDISNDKTYVESTSFEWKELADQPIMIGDYYHNGEIISISSDRYDLVIAPIIQVGEEEHKKQVALAVPEDVSGMIEPDVVPSIEQIPVTSIPVDRDTSIALPPPKLPDYSEEISSAENLSKWTEINNNLNLYINKLKSSEVTWDNHHVTFDPPLTYPDGHVQNDFYVYEHTDLNDLISYIQQLDAKQRELIARIQANI